LTEKCGADCVGFFGDLR